MKYMPKKKKKTSNKECLSKRVQELQELVLDYKVKYPISDIEPLYPCLHVIKSKLKMTRKQYLSIFISLAILTSPKNDSIN